jgi:hypothetical protein
MSKIFTNREFLENKIKYFELSYKNECAIAEIFKLMAQSYFIVNEYLTESEYLRTEAERLRLTSKSKLIAIKSYDLIVESVKLYFDTNISIISICEKEKSTMENFKTQISNAGSFRMDTYSKACQLEIKAKLLIEKAQEIESNPHHLNEKIKRYTDEQIKIYKAYVKIYELKVELHETKAKTDLLRIKYFRTNIKYLYANDTNDTTMRFFAEKEMNLLHIQLYLEKIKCDNLKNIINILDKDINAKIEEQKKLKSSI